MPRGADQEDAPLTNPLPPAVGFSDQDLERRGHEGEGAGEGGGVANDSVLHRLQYAPPGPTRRIVVDFSALSNYRTAADAAVVERRLEADLKELEAALVSRAERRRGLQLGLEIGSSPAGPQGHKTPGIPANKDATGAGDGTPTPASDGGEAAEPSSRHPSATGKADAPADSPDLLPAAAEETNEPAAAPEDIGEDNATEQTEQLADDARPELKLSIEQRPVDLARISGTDVLFHAASPPLLDASGEPLLPSERLHRLTAWGAWPVILCIAAAFGVIISTVAIDIDNEGVRSPLYMLGFLLLLLPLGLNTLAYGRAITTLIITGNFEFWYLAAQIIVFSTCETLQVLDRGIPMAVAVIPRVFLTWFAIVGLLCIDASRLSRVIKGIIMLVGCVLFVALGATWRVNSPIGDDEISVLFFRTTIGSLATSSYLTLGIFCGKFALQSLCMRRCVVLVSFSWAEDDTCLLRRRVLPPALVCHPSELRAADDDAAEATACPPSGQ